MQKKFIRNDEYEPAEDTFFMAEYVEKEKGKSALDVGSGSGYLTKLLSQNFSFESQKNRLYFHHQSLR